MCTNMRRLDPIGVSVYPCVSGISCKSFYISGPTMCQTLWNCGSTQNNRFSPQTEDKGFWFSRNSLQNKSIQPAWPSTKMDLPTKLSPNTYAWISHSKLPAHWPWKKLIGFPVFDHHQALRSSSPILLSRKSSNMIGWFMRRASAKAWEKNGVSIAFLIHFLGREEGFEAIRICIQLNSTPVAQSQITISNLEVRKLTGRTACFTNPCKSKLVMSFLIELVRC